MNEYDSMKLNFVSKPTGKTCLVVKELEMLCNDKHKFQGLIGSAKSSKSIGLRSRSLASQSFLQKLK